MHNAQYTTISPRHCSGLANSNSGPERIANTQGEQKVVKQQPNCNCRTTGTVSWQEHTKRKRQAAGWICFGSVDKIHARADLLHDIIGRLKARNFATSQTPGDFSPNTKCGQDTNARPETTTSLQSTRIARQEESRRNRHRYRYPNPCIHERDFPSCPTRDSLLPKALHPRDIQNTRTNSRHKNAQREATPMEGRWPRPSPCLN